MAKHWKDLVPSKKEEQQKDTVDFSKLLQTDPKQEQVLEDISGANPSLKALLEEQKTLEQNMDALTGKKPEQSNSNRFYDNEIKSPLEKRKEEQKREKERASHLDAFKQKKVKENKWLEKRSLKTNKDTRPKQPAAKQASILKKVDEAKAFYDKLDAKQSKLKEASRYKKANSLNTVNTKKTAPTPKKEKTALKNIAKKIDKTTSFLKTLDNNKTAFTNIKKAPSKTTKKIKPSKRQTVKKDPLFSNTTTKPITIKKAINTVKTVSKTTDKAIQFYNKIGDTSNIKNKLASVNQLKTNDTIKSSNTESNLNLDQLDNKKSKVDSIFNTANKTNKKVKTATQFLENTLIKKESLLKKEPIKDTSLSTDILKTLFTKKENKTNAKGFNINVNDVKATVSKLKTIKKGVDNWSKKRDELRKTKKKDSGTSRLSV